MVVGTVSQAVPAAMSQVVRRHMRTRLNLRAECDVNNKAKIFTIEILFVTLKSAVKSETVECNLH